MVPRNSYSLICAKIFLRQYSGQPALYKGTISYQKFQYDTPSHVVAWEQAILERLIGPRIGMGPEEAYFCSKFFNTLHAIEAANFNRYGERQRSKRGKSDTRRSFFLYCGRATEKHIGWSVGVAAPATRPVTMHFFILLPSRSFFFTLFVLARWLRTGYEQLVRGRNACCVVSPFSACDTPRYLKATIFRKGNVVYSAVRVVYPRSSGCLVWPNGWYCKNRLRLELVHL